MKSEKLLSMANPLTLEKIMQANVINLHGENPSESIKQKDSHGVKEVVIATRYRNENSEKAVQLAKQIKGYKVALCLISAVDIFLMYNIFSESFSGVLGGSMGVLETVITAITAVVSLLAYTKIGTLWNQEDTKKKVSGYVLYVALLVVLFFPINGVWGKEIDSFFDVYDSGGFAGAVVQHGLSIGVKSLMLILMSCVYTTPGLAFIYSKNKIETGTEKLHTLKNHLNTCQQYVDSYNREKTLRESAKKERIQLESELAFYEDNENEGDLAKEAKVKAIKIYKETLSKIRSAIPMVSQAMSNEEQAKIAKQRQELDRLIVQANTLKA
jgi:hypothetical protein